MKEVRISCEEIIFKRNVSIIWYILNKVSKKGNGHLNSEKEEIL